MKKLKWLIFGFFLLLMPVVLEAGEITAVIKMGAKNSSVKSGFFQLLLVETYPGGDLKKLPIYHFSAEFNTTQKAHTLLEIFLPERLILIVDGKRMEFDREEKPNVSHPTADDGTDLYEEEAAYTCSVENLSAIAKAEKIHVILPSHLNYIKATSYLSSGEIEKNIQKFYDEDSLLDERLPQRN